MSNDYLVWIDLEMTGLDPEQDHIIEIATIVTDSDLNLIAEGPNLVVHQSEAVLANMNEWCVKQHGQSGLTAKVLASDISVAEAEQQTLSFLRKYLKDGQSPICGNSVGQDRRFLCKYMPELETFFHYRCIDVSSIKELAKRWQPKVLEGLTKEGTHLALDDIRDSINELRHYRQHMFKLN